ncbi:MAG: DUF5330 domain-containing protein [Methyloceanibacter sp.]
MDSSAEPQTDRESKAMMFLLRTAFWLMIIVLLLPTDERQRSEVYGTAQAAVNDLATFCERNPDTCAKGKDAFGVFVQKAQFGARMVMDMINGRGTLSEGETAPALQGSGTESLFEQPPQAGPYGSQDTLNPDDRDDAWGGPGT